MSNGNYQGPHGSDLLHVVNMHKKPICSHRPSIHLYGIISVYFSIYNDDPSTMRLPMQPAAAGPGGLQGRLTCIISFFSTHLVATFPEQRFGSVERSSKKVDYISPSVAFVLERLRLSLCMSLVHPLPLLTPSVLTAVLYVRE